jgi:DNA-binding transcriptional MerR regulator
VSRNQNDVIDFEWVQLVLEAREIGMSINEIKEFIKETS